MNLSFTKIYLSKKKDYRVLVHITLGFLISFNMRFPQIWGNLIPMEDFEVFMVLFLRNEDERNVDNLIQFL